MSWRGLFNWPFSLEPRTPQSFGLDMDRLGSASAAWLKTLTNWNDMVAATFSRKSLKSFAMLASRFQFVPELMYLPQLLDYKFTYSPTVAEKGLTLKGS